MSSLNPLNDLSRVYLDTVYNMNQKKEETEEKRWEGELNLQMKTMANLKKEAVETPAAEEEKMKKDDKLFGSPNKKKKHDCASKVKHEEYGMGECIKEMHDLDENGNVAHYDVLFGHGVEKQVPVASLQIIEKHMHEHVIHEKKAAKDYDGDGKVESGKDEYFGSRDKAIKKAMGKKSPETIEASRRKKDKLFGSPKNESFSSWRNDLREIVSATPMTDVESEKEVTEKKGIKNKVIINPKMSEAVAEIGGQVISEKEVDVKDTRRTVDAIRAYDRSKDASRDATYDTDKGNKKKGDKEKKYAAKERGEIKKDDPNWKNRKYHTGMHGEETEVVEGYGKKKKKGHDCASKVKHEEYGIGFCIKGQHTILEDGTVGHYDVEFEEYIVENCPVEELEILVSEMHMHKEMKEGVVSKEVKALQKAGKTLKDTPVVKADKIDTANYKGQKFGVKEDDDWIQKAVKRPGAFTRKAKAAGMGVQQFAKSVDANPGKYSTRTKKQANLAQTFASMKKEDVEELFYTLIAE